MFAFIEHPIAATLDATNGGTTIAIGVVTVIAGLGIITEGAPNPIAAARALTAIDAGIGVDTIAIVALFAMVEHAIAAGLKGAVGGATVTIDVVAIIAAFRVIALEAHHTIAAARCLAGVGAGVVVDLVTVITGFLTVKGMPVAAAVEAAIIEAAIALHLVAIIAGFTQIAPTVAAGFDLTGAIATVTRVGIAVITGLVAVESAVTAAF